MKNFKQEYISSLVGISQSTYSRLENDDTNDISLNQVAKLAEIYNMSTEELIGWNGQVSIGTVNGVGINQGTVNLNINTPES